MKTLNSLVYEIMCPIPECKKKIAINLIMQVSTPQLMEKYNRYCNLLSFLKKHKSCLFCMK